MSDILFYIPPPIIAAGLGFIGGAIIEIVDFYFTSIEKDLDLKDAIDMLFQKYSIRVAISAVVGALFTYAISITPEPAPIWQLVIGMSAMGIASKFRYKKS